MKKDNSKLWFVYAMVTTVFWGVWGAFANVSIMNGFPPTLVYCVWAITMIPPALIVLNMVGWKLEYDKKSVLLGSTIGLLGAGGQMILFQALKTGPPYLIYPIISLSPVITIALSYVFIKERTGWLGALGIVLALVALPLFDFSGVEGESSLGSSWFVLAALVLIAWGLQAYVMKVSNETMKAESIFFYMMLSGLLIIPIALMMTDFQQEINWGWNGLYLTAGVQLLNAIGALSLVYAFRYGKAIVVSPLTNAGAPLMTSIISMIFLSIMPGPVKLGAIVLAILSAVFLAVDSE